MAEYEPLVIERAEGCWLVDVDGRRYLDGVSSLWCNLHGHRHPRIEAAIVEQLGKLAHATTLGMSNPPAIELARRLAELAPGDLNHVFFSSDGSCAVEAALKIAFQYWRQCDQPRPEKTTYLAFDSAYHGDTLGSTAVGGIERFHALFEPLLFDVVRLPPPDRRHGDAAIHLARLEEVLAERHDEIAALVIEPLVQGAAGMIMQPPGYLRGVRELTATLRRAADRRRDRHRLRPHGPDVRLRARRRDARPAVPRQEPHRGLPADGRDARHRAQCTTPSSATTRSGRTFHHGHTFGGNPLAAAAACASLDLLAEERHARGRAAAQGRRSSPRRSRRWPIIRTSATSASWA